MPRVPVETTPPTERAVLVFVNENADEDEYVEEELDALSHAAGIENVGSIRQRVEKPTTPTYIGSGKIEEVLATVKDCRADLALFDCELSGIQQRNLNERLKTKVVDRTQLILDIFAQRAHSREGMLQVELAQLEYLMPRITSAYTKFERQKGGIGLRGPGETQLESDRRRIKARIQSLNKEIEEVRRNRSQHRASRRKFPFPFASLCGYTSAGKSTVMNLLSGSEIFADPMLFATLDPTTRKVELQHGYSVFLTDTVGFVRHLPHQLVAAFRATLDEISESDFLIHIVDVSHPNFEIQFDAVMETLSELDADGKPILTVFNKTDKLKDRGMINELLANNPNSVAISALKRAGISELLDAMEKMIRSMLQPIHAIIPYDKSGLVQDCYDFGRVLKVEHMEDGIHIEAELVSAMADKLSMYKR